MLLENRFKDRVIAGDTGIKAQIFIQVNVGTTPIFGEVQGVSHWQRFIYFPLGIFVAYCFLNAPRYCDRCLKVTSAHFYFAWLFLHLLWCLCGFDTYNYTIKVEESQIYTKLECVGVTGFFEFRNRLFNTKEARDYGIR